VVLSPGFDHDLCFLQAVEDLSVQQFIPELGVEALAISFDPAIDPLDQSRLSIPRAAWLDVERGDAESRQPLPDSDGDELRPVIRADVLRDALFDKEPGEAMEHIIRLEGAPNLDR
jgi:hypothetical protein